MGREDRTISRRNGRKEKYGLNTLHEVLKIEMKMRGEKRRVGVFGEAMSHGSSAHMNGFNPSHESLKG